MTNITFYSTSMFGEKNERKFHIDIIDISAKKIKLIASNLQTDFRIAGVNGGTIFFTKEEFDPGVKHNFILLRAELKNIE